MSALHIPELAPDTIFYIGSFPITNTIINVWLALIFFLIIGILLRRQLSLRPGKLQNFLEYILEALLGTFDQVTGDRKKTLRFLPIVGTIFFFVLVSNWMGLLPGIGSITYGGKEALRPANTDLNLTVVMALVAVVGSHLFGLFTVGVLTHIGKFIQIKGIFTSITKGPIAIFTALIQFMVGILEIISEMAKVLSLSLRLFGNIFAGEVLIIVIRSLIGIVVPAPFMMLELLVGLIQAAVFAILTLVYLNVASDAPHGEEEAAH